MWQKSDLNTGLAGFEVQLCFQEQLFFEGDQGEQQGVGGWWRKVGTNPYTCHSILWFIWVSKHCANVKFHIHWNNIFYRLRTIGSCHLLATWNIKYNITHYCYCSMYSFFLTSQLSRVRSGFYIFVTLKMRTLLCPEQALNKYLCVF